MTERILHLNLKKKWFDLIASGKKKTECREIKPYWEKRLLQDTPHKEYINGRISCIHFNSKEFDYVVFKNGYAKTSPEIKVEWKGLTFGLFEGNICFAIKLGKIVNGR